MMTRCICPDALMVIAGDPVSGRLENKGMSQGSEFKARTISIGNREKRMNVPNLALRMAIRAVLMTAPGLAATTAYAHQSQDMVVYGQAVHYRPDDQSVATGLQMQIIDAPVSISVMTDQMLKQANARTLYEVADLVPGLNQAGEGYGEVSLRLRGQNVTQPRVDGINYGTT